MQTFLLGHHEVATLVLGHLDLPLPGGPGGPGVYVDVDLVAGVGGGDPHVLAGVVAADDGRDGAPRVADSQGVRGAVSDIGSMEVGIGRGGVGSIGDWGGEDHRVEVNPQLADVRGGLAEGVGAGVRVRAGGVGGDDGVGVVGAAGAPAGDGEHAAHSEGGGAGPGGGAALGRALRGREAGAVVAVGGATGGVGESDHVENAQHLPLPLLLALLLGLGGEDHWYQQE